MEKDLPQWLVDTVVLAAVAACLVLVVALAIGAVLGDLHMVGHVDPAPVP